jgi:hypothetical protein
MQDSLEFLDNLDLTNVDLSRPLVKDKTPMEVTIKSIEVVNNKAGTGKNLKLQYTTNETFESTEGKTVNPGCTLHELVSLVTTDKFDPRENLARIKLAALGTQEGKFIPSELIGQTMSVIVGIEQDKAGLYAPKNRISKYIPKK